jgi:hypothetical protein
MRITALLLTTTLALFVAWVVLRDWRPVDTSRLTAQSAAAQLDATLLDRRGPVTWRIRIAGPQATRCMDLDLRTFTPDPDHGYRGLHTAPCPAH